ncbi:Vomp family autotransporter [Bartonella sp. TT121SHDZB]|uniref:Vomp family autotransporter n=1 Tax=Bartonella sp. TT121SHDZB TaxID=3243580 RepID=UPI0035CF6483
MKKKYSTPNLIKVVSLSTVMATLLSSVSPVFAANLSITGDLVRSTSGTDVQYPHGSHGSIVFSGDDDYCGVDNVIGRGGKQQQAIPDVNRITAKEQYNRFINDQEFASRHPYGTTTEKVTWAGDGLTVNSRSQPMGGYMGAISTRGIANALPEAYGVYSFATGCGSAATGNYSTVFGAGATAKAGGAQAFGVSALAGGIASVAMGVGSEASGTSAVAIGGLATASGKNSISIGESSQATQDDAIAVGSNAEGSGINSVAIGKFASASGYNSVALGLQTKASNDYTVAIGSKAEAQALGSIAIGGGEPADNGKERKVIAKGKNSIAIGTHTFAETAHSVAIGINAQVLVIDGVAVGGGAVSRIDKHALGYDPVTNTVTTKSDLAWKSTAGDFSVGNTNQNLTRQITNVAAGSKDTDAVNVAQLKAMRDVMAGAGGGWKISVNDEGSTDVNPSDIVDFSVRSNGGVGKDNLKIEKDSANNKHKVKFALSDTLKLTSVTTGQSSMSDDGFMITNGTKITIDGIDAGNQQITGVKDGTEDDHAVNYKQLKEVKEAAKMHWQLTVNGENPMSIGQNNTVNFTSVGKEGGGNIKIVGDGRRNVTFDLADDITVTSVTAGNSFMNNDGFMITGGPNMTTAGIYAGDKTIKGVAAGEDDTDAVNFAQLKKLREDATQGWKLSVNGEDATYVKAGSTVDFVGVNAEDSNEESKNIKITKNDDNTVKFDLNDIVRVKRIIAGKANVSDNGFVITGGPNMTTGGIYAGNKKITGVLAGTDAEDAVNYQQLQDFTARIKTGWKLAVEDEEATDVEAESTVKFVAAADNDSHKNIKIVRGGDNAVAFDLDELIKVNKIKVGEEVTITDNGLVIKRGPSITYGGIDAGNKEIRNVAEGQLGMDAVNLNQLKEVEEKIKKVADNSLVKWNEDGKLITIGAEKGGAKIDITGNEGDRTIAGVKAAKNDNEAVNKKQLDESIGKINNNIENISASAVLYDKNDDSTVNYESVTLGGNKVNGQVALHNVKDGEISDQSHDAINGSQINKISGDVAKFFGGGTSFDNGVFRRPRYNLTTIDENGRVEQKEHNDVGSALSGLDMNIRHVNQHLLYAINDVAKYFGGGAGYDENGEWHAPTFKVYQINDNGTVSKQPYSNVADAFEGVNNSFTNIHNQILDIKQNSLVQQEEKFGPITIGAKTSGSVINIANNEGSGRTISGVLKGRVAEDSTEAVNGAQLYNIGTNITKYFGGSTDVLSGIEPTFLIQGQTHRNVTDAFTGVNVSITNLDNKIIEMKENNLVQQDKKTNIITIGEKTAGTEINIAGYAGVARSISGVKAAEKDDEAVNKKQLDKSIEKISKDIDFASAAAVLYDKNEDGSINYGSVTLGGKNNVGPVSLLNVKDGRIAANSTDAITGNQLYLMSNQLAAYFGGGAGYNNGKWNAPNFKVAQFNADGTVGEEKNYNNVAEALGGINGGMVNINNRIDDVINKVDSDALKWNNDKKAYDAGRDGKPNKIVNVADGKIAEGSKDAVNGGQLWKTNERVTGVEKDVKHLTNRVDNISTTVTDIGETVFNIENKVNDIAEDAVRYDRDENGKKTNKITLAGGDASEPVLIDNVADGKIEKGSKEAVNGGQLHDYTKEQMKIILDESKHYTDQRVNNIVIDAIDDAVDQSKQYTDMKFDVLNYSIESVKKEARQAAAIGLAVSNLRYNDTPGKLSVGFGTGLWRSQSAFAFGAGYTSENGKYRSNISATTSGGHWGVGAGFNMTLN